MKVDVFSIGIPAVLPETASSQLKMDGWKTTVSFWGPAYFQLLNFRWVYPSLDSFYATRLFPTELASNDRILHTCMPVALRTQMRHP